MTTRLPLVAAQPGIWMAERLSTLPGAWSVAHYVELRGALDPALLGKAIVAGLQQADTLSLRFEEEEGEVWQWVAADRTFGEPSIIDLIEGDETVFEKEPLVEAARMGQLNAYRHKGFWQCMDTLREKNLLEALWQSGQAPWKIWE